MSLEGVLIWLVIGAIAGWAAGNIVKGYGFGLVGNIVVGIAGAFVGGWIFGLLGIFNTLGVIGTIIGSTAGAVLLLVVIRFIKRAT